jgi:hypothetical protein
MLLRGFFEERSSLIVNDGGNISAFRFNAALVFREAGCIFLMTLAESRGGAPCSMDASACTCEPPTPLSILLSAARSNEAQWYPAKGAMRKEVQSRLPSSSSKQGRG